MPSKQEEAAEAADKVYEDSYASLGLAPRNVSGIKEAMVEALLKGDRPRWAAKHYLASRGLGISKKTGKLIKVEPKTEKVEKAAKAGREPKAEKQKKEAKPEPEKKAGKKPKEEKLFESVKEIDRKMLLQSAKEIFALTGRKVDVSLPDEDLRKKIYAEIQNLISPENQAIVDRMSGDYKIVDLLGDCLGIYVDMRSADCVRCIDQPDCVRRFAGNLRDGFYSVAKGKQSGDLDLSAVIEAAKKLVSEAEKISDPKGEERKKKANGVPSPPKKEKPKAVSKIDPNKSLVIYEVKNPMKPGTLEHAFAASVLLAGTSKIREIEEIYATVFDAEDDGYETADLVASVQGLVKSGIACWPEDLPKDVVKSLDKKTKKSLGL